MRGLAVLGSTGTIGTFTLEIVEKFPEQFRVLSLAAGKNIESLRKQIVKFRPKIVSVEAFDSVSLLSQDFPDVTFVSGKEGLEACIDQDGVDTVVVGVVGFAGLSPALHAIRRSKRVALANKESLVVGGSLLKAELEKSDAELIPVDSEHNGLFQLLLGKKREEIASIVLTASGGPLWKRKDLPLEDVTPQIAIKHPNWNMGPKISVDSATLMNKGLEVIEAHFLYGYSAEKIEVWIHPQSIVHSAIWLTDNSCMAQLTKPDMKSSIGYALTYPERLAEVIPRFSFKDMASLEFYEPDHKRFPCLEIAYETLRRGQSAVIALNAANEIAVEAFLQGRILFPDIPKVIERALSRHRSVSVDNLDTVFAIDAETRAKELSS
jgi:1-deoxy-D-xylulose-5-phosphate reductoisomerase